MRSSLKKITFIKKDNNKIAIPFALISSLIMLLCFSFYTDYTWNAFLTGAMSKRAACVRFLAFGVLFYFVIQFFLSFEIKECKISSFVYDFLYNKSNSFFIRTGIILLAWVPYMIIMFPACTDSDTKDMVAQILGNKDACWSCAAIVLKNENVILNNHHPVLFTLVLGLFVFIGRMIGSYNIGLFLFALIQCILFSLTLSYQTGIVNKACNKALSYGSLLFFALNPIFPLWGMSLVKDVSFSILIFYSTVFLYRLVFEPKSVRGRNIAVFVIVLNLWMLIRNNGFYILVLMLPITVLILKNNRESLKKTLITIAAALAVYEVLIMHIIFPLFDITGGSVREIMSVPFMQTANYIVSNEDDLSDEDKELLYKVFDIDSVHELAERYQKEPFRSDIVKVKFNKETGPRALPKYFVFWAKCLAKDPESYINAYGGLVNGWFISETHKDYTYCNGIKDEKISELLTGFSNPESLRAARDGIQTEINILKKIPVLSLFVNFSFYTWVYIISLLVMMVRKKYKELLVSGLLMLNYFVCFIGPVAYLRYALPAIICMPFIIFMTFSDIGTKYGKD